jgi:hypothetical protein
VSITEQGTTSTSTVTTIVTTAIPATTTVTTRVPTTTTYTTTITRPATTLTSIVTRSGVTTLTQTRTLTTTQKTTIVTTVTISYPPPPINEVTCYPRNTTVGVAVRCEAEIATAVAIAPTGLVSWSSNVAGTFTGKSCKLVPYISEGICTVKFTPKATGHSVNITASYPGNPPSKNPSSVGFSTVTVLPQTPKVVLSCTPKSATAGSKKVITCRAKVTGYLPTGTVTWSQSGPGTVSFSTQTCTLSKGVCSVKMTASGSGSVTIQASYSGDPNNKGSYSIITLTIT